MFDTGCQKLETLIPLDELEQEALSQIYANIGLPQLKKMAIMPDCHAGYDLPIGGVALLDGLISPSYVGYDIGCGMLSINTKIPKDNLFPDERSKKDLFEAMYRAIPTGVGGEYSKNQDYPEFKSAIKELNDPVNQKIAKQIGTLGSGNHFIEIGENRAGEICLTIHSGSRGAGYTVAGHYMKLGRFHDINSELGQSYLNDMNFMLNFALENRKRMAKKFLELIDIRYLSKRILGDMINENHNHAIVTENGILHRKGATPADFGQLGVIPANMRDGVYITRGLGNEKYLSSASHGAGRIMSRSKAKKTVNLESFKNTMTSVIAKIDVNTIDESPFAYKDIDTVIGYQKGIVVDIVDKITPIINIKGV